MAQAAHVGDRARQLVDRLRTDWRGESWDSIVVDDVTLLSPPDQWPAVIALDYRLNRIRGRWVDSWGENDQTLRSEPLEVASGLWLALVGVRFLDLAEPPREDRLAR